MLPKRTNGMAGRGTSRLRRGLALAAGLVIAAGGAGGCAKKAESIDDRVRAVFAEVPLIDGHNDLPWQVRSRAEGDLSRMNLFEDQPEMHTDIPRLRAGGLGGQFWSVFVPTSMEPDEAVRATLEQIDVVHQLCEQYPETFELARTADDVERIHAEGKIASMIGMEGGHSINESLAVLRMMYRLGARYMTLTHSRNTPWADSATDDAVVGGLTEHGEAIVREMNRLGMLVDISHVAPSVMHRALDISRAPVIFSHSSSRGVTDHPRNVPDDVLRRLPENGGVVMITFVGLFVNEEERVYSDRRRAERERARERYHGDDEEAREKLVREAMERWDRANPRPRARLADVADHIDHARSVCGIDHLGIGGDYDGTSSIPDGLDDVSKYVDLFEELARRGYSDSDLRKIAGENLLRVFREAERVAAEIRAEEAGS